MPIENNPFKQLLVDDNLPENHKDDVLSTVDATLLLLDFAELFTFKQVETYYHLVKTVIQPDSQSKK